METEEDSDIIFKAARKDIHLNEEECLSIAKDLGYIFDDSELEDYSSIESRERFRQYKTWRELVKLKTVRSRTLKTIKRVLGIMLDQLEEILMTWNTITGDDFLVKSLLFWLMMPRFKFGDAVKDPLSTVGQLSANLEQMRAIDTAACDLFAIWRPWCFWKDFRRVFDDFIKDLDRSSRSRFWMALQRDLWLALITFPEIEQRFYHVAILPDDLSAADICDEYRELLFDIHSYIIKLSRSKLSQSMTLKLCFNMCADLDHQLFLAERTKLVELINFRYLLKPDWFHFDGKHYFRIQPSGALAAQASLDFIPLFCGPADWTPCWLGIQSVKLLVLVLCRTIIEKLDSVEAHIISLWVILLRHLELAYECRRSQEYPHDKHYLLPTCVELAFAIPLESPDSCKHVCEFTYSRDTLDCLERRGAEILKEAKKPKPELKASLLYYQHDYDGFKLCCSTMDRNMDPKFRCVGHNYCQNELSEAVCPLLKRQFFCHPETCHRTDSDCS